MIRRPFLCPSIPRSGTVTAGAVVLGLLLAGCASTPTTTDNAPATTGDGAVAPDAGAADRAPADEALRLALLDLRERDQDARAAMIEVMKNATRLPGGGFQITDEQHEVMLAVQEIDAESTAFLRAMVDERGWPGISQIGDDGARAAWLLAQHADAAPEFQAQILALMEPMVASNEVHPPNFALLTDRVLAARGEPQVYGTQFRADADGVQRPGPTIDWANVDERRAAVGLPPIAEYAERIRATYGGEVGTTPIEE